MSLGKIKADGTTPYTYVVRNFTGAQVYTNTSNSDEMEIPDNILNGITDGIDITVTDATGKVGNRRVDVVTMKLLKKYPTGITKADPDINNAIEAINFSHDHNLTWTNTVPNLDAFNINTDVKFASWGNTTYNHTVAPSGAYECPFDAVVRAAYLTGNSVENRVSVRIGLLMTFGDTFLNNGTTRTQFIGTDDIVKRYDGSNLVIPQSNQYAPPCYASPVFKTWARKYVLGFYKRYYLAINDGTILCTGFVTTNAGEAEYETYSRGYNPETDSYGDFNHYMIDAFKIKFPQYNSLNNGDIMLADRTNTPLGRNWCWFLADKMREFEWDLIDYIKANVPQLTRTKFGMMDSGSFVDGLASRRRTPNSAARMRDEIMLVKCNDNPGSDAFNYALMEYIASLKDLFGCFGVIEPSPTDYNFNDPASRHMARAAKEYGIGVSMFGYNAFAPFNSENNYETISVPRYRDIFVNGKINKLNHPLSEIYNSGGFNNMKIAYEAKKAATGKRVDLLTFDDVKI